MADQGRISEERIGFDLREWNRLGESLAGFDFHLRALGIGGIDGDYRGGADGGLVVAGFVDDEAVAGLHAAEISERDGIGDTIPNSRAVLLQVGKGILGRLGFKEIVCHDASIRSFGKKRI